MLYQWDKIKGENCNIIVFKSRAEYDFFKRLAIVQIEMVI